LNRELTWLEFCDRVLNEAEDTRNPLLERAKFLAIVGSNLDEFFMKRVGGLKQQVGAGVSQRSADGRTPQQQISESYEKIRALEGRQQKLVKKLRKNLAEVGVTIAAHDELSPEDQQTLRQFYLENVFPLVTPQGTDPAHPFPFVSNLSLNLLVTPKVVVEGKNVNLVRIKVPLGPDIPRFMQVPDRLVFVPLEQVMAANLDLLLPELEIEACEYFRVTRNANTETDEDHAEDLLGMIESELRERKFAPIVRMSVAPGMVPLHRGRLSAEFGLDEGQDVFEMGELLGTRDLWEIASLPLPEFKDPPHHPLDHPILIPERNIFHTLREEGSVLLHHPYHSFGTSVERFLGEAAEDPKVRAIKMTLYRTAKDSRVIEHLITAARNGKQVAVVVELKARFDEAANIRWASRLERVGIHVTYGVLGLKTHTKILLVVRRDYNGLRRYVHVASGNYNSETARMYTDLGLLTCDPEIGKDETELFN
ncbi:MAG: polyphosphate kinase 1, partial [Myxococcales bacterium]|nr:polyphosphate kinase 1 [Myxococcales bacterium]